MCICKFYTLTQTFSEPYKSLVVLGTVPYMENWFEWCWSSLVYQKSQKEEQIAFQVPPTMHL